MTQDMIKDFKKRWKINEQYWYPLVKYESEYNDVISLDLNLLIENSMLSYLCRLLETKRLDEVFELRENGQLIVHSVMVDLEETLKSDYYWMNEGYLFDRTYSWILYKSHEMTLTIGNEEIIKLIKNEWENWKDYLKWDFKNED